MSSWPVLSGLDVRRAARRSTQRGQALVYGLFLITAGLAAFALMFNAGQLTAEKTKLVNTADAAAYSGGVMHARALNFTAYTNRALMANEVLVAQSVSLTSWARFIQTRTASLMVAFPECQSATGFAGMAAQPFRYGVDYALLCRVMAEPAFGGATITAASALETALQASMVALELNKASIQLSQTLVHMPLVFQEMRNRTMQEVVDANYRGDGTARVEPSLGQIGGLLTLTDGWSGFTRHYSGDDRLRFAEATRTAAGQDGFVQSRQWDSRAVLPRPDCLPRLQYDRVVRRGGTGLVDYDEWRAEDTESWRSHSPRSFGRSCRENEALAIGYGAGEASPTDNDRDHTAQAYGNAHHNAQAHGLMNAAYSTRSTSYTGLPGFYDLSPDALNQADGQPVLNLSVRVIRPRDQLRTSDGRSAVTSAPRINAYRSEVARDEMAAVSASQVYFARPTEHALNTFGRRVFGDDRAQEIGSLFNPYWQVRLADPRADVAMQRSRQALGN